jgi:PKD repeat protein
VNLTVIDNNGDKTTKSTDIFVLEPLPEAVVTYSPANPEVGQVITFDASKSKDKNDAIIFYEWDFGDGYSGKRASIKHQYIDRGAYDVRLTVTNKKGMQNTTAISVVVNSNKEPINESINRREA